MEWQVQLQQYKRTWFSLWIEMAKWRHFNKTIFRFRKKFRKQARILMTVWIKRTVRCDEHGRLFKWIWLDRAVYLGLFGRSSNKSGPSISSVLVRLLSYSTVNGHLDRPLLASFTVNLNRVFILEKTRTRSSEKTFGFQSSRRRDDKSTF